MKRALIVAPHFAPINAPDGHRVRLNLPYYGRNGWQVEVLAVRPEYRPDWRDDSLLESLPPDVPVHRCGAIPLKVSRIFGVGTMGWRALPFLAAKGSALLARGRFDLIVFSTTQFNTLYLGPLWKAMFRVPYVVDLQDPWHNDYYSRPGAPKPPGGWKYRLAHMQSAVLEPFCFRRASGFSFVSEDYKPLLGRRYSWFGEKASITLPFAAPVDDFALASRDGSQRPHLICRCVGALNKAFRTSLNAFFAMAAEARRKESYSFPWRFEFVGTSYAGADRKSDSLALEAATAHGMEDLTSESTDRVSYRDSLGLMRGADLVLVLGSDDPSYAPSRLATVSASGRPVLVVATSKSVLMRRAAKIPGVMCKAFDADFSVAHGMSSEDAFHRADLLPVPRLPEEYRPDSLAARECELWSSAVREQLQR